MRDARRATSTTPRRRPAPPPSRTCVTLTRQWLVEVARRGKKESPFVGVEVAGWLHRDVVFLLFFRANLGRSV